MNSAATIARSVARSADRELSGEVATIEKTPPAPPGLKAVCTIVARNGGEQRLLDVVEFDYRDRMKAIATHGEEESAAHGPAYAAVVALVAAAGFVRAIFRPSKSKRAKIQLAVGFVVCTLLIVWSALLIAAAVTALISSTTGASFGGWLSNWLTQHSVAVLLGGLVTTGSYVALRDTIIRESNKVAQMIDYHTRPDYAKDLADSLGSAIDAIRDQHPCREIHILAYSFGSVLLLDTVIPFDGHIPTHRSSFVHSITSITTVGCPFDFARLYLPKYFDGRQALRSRERTPIAWNNIFIASDLFGSNFATDVGPDGREIGEGGQSQSRGARGDEPNGTRIDEVSGSFIGPADMPVESFRYLPQETLTKFGWIKQTALRQHARYWGLNGGCWSFVLDQWIPRVGGVDSPPDVRLPDGVDDLTAGRWQSATGEQVRAAGRPERDPTGESGAALSSRSPRPIRSPPPRRPVAAGPAAASVDPGRPPRGSD